MRVIEPGHCYALALLDGVADDVEILTFVKRVGPNYPGNRHAHAGTTLQEVWRASLDRLRYVHRQSPCVETEVAIEHLRLALYSLEARAARVHHRSLPIIALEQIESAPTCPHCLHVWCSTCRP